MDIVGAVAGVRIVQIGVWYLRSCSSCFIQMEGNVLRFGKRGKSCGFIGIFSNYSKPQLSRSLISL